jgi:serine/threonine protein kinase
MMPASATDLSTLSRLLDEAMDLPSSELEGWLQALPAEHQHLQSQLRQMLADRDSTISAGFLSEGPRLTEPADESIAHPDDLVGPYQLIREIGSGGMGAVWLAERADGSLKRRIALKLPRLAWGAGLAERMARERDIGAILEHPNIARLYDAGVDAKGRPYLALEYIDGQPLDAWCEAQALTIAQRIRLFLQVARAVAYAHGRLVVHRDLKPSNVLVTADGQAHLLDFGIAKLLDESASGKDLTHEQGRVLTPHYASPEQIKGETVTVASDVYSLGALLYELLTERHPYSTERKSLGALEQAMLEGEPPLASSRTKDATTAKQLRGEIDAIWPRRSGASPRSAMRRLTRWHRTSNGICRASGCWHGPTASPTACARRSGDIASRLLHPGRCSWQCSAVLACRSFRPSAPTTPLNVPGSSRSSSSTCSRSTNGGYLAIRIFKNCRPRCCCKEGPS